MAARLLRKTGEAIKHSPSALRRVITGGNRGSYQMALAQAQDPFKVGLSFNITYAGCEDLDCKGDEGYTFSAKLTDPTVARKVRESATVPRQRVLMVVNDKTITVSDPKGERAPVTIPLYRVAFAGSHPMHVNAFAFVERIRDTDRFVCHVMLCSSEHMARTIVRVVSRAFQNAFLEWNSKEKRRGRGRLNSKSLSAAGSVDEGTESPAEEASSPADDKAEDLSAEPEVKDRLSEEEKDRRALHRSFYRRSVVVASPERLDTGPLDVTPDEFSLEEAAEYVETLPEQEAAPAAVAGDGDGAQADKAD